MASNKKIKNRISKLLEFKSNEFRKKYYLLSFLSETKISKNKNLINEFECFCNALIESNANKPSFDSINNLLKNSFMLSIKNEKIVESKIQNLNKLISYKFKQDLNESIIDQELNNIDIKNTKLDLKLVESIKYAVKNNISFLYESYKDDGSDSDAEDPEESERSSISARKAYFDELKRQNELLFGNFDEIDDVDDLHDTEPQLLPAKQKKSLTARLKDRSRAPSATSIKDEIPTYPNAEKYATYDDVFLKTIKADKYDSKIKKPIFSKEDKVRRLAFNSLENNLDRRKFYIIDEIKKYLYILRIPNITSAETKSLYDQEALKLQRTSNIINTMSALASGLSEDRAEKIKLEFAKYLDDKNYTLNLMKESDLLKILVKAAGPVKRQNVTDFMKFLNLEYPKSGMTGDEYELKDDEKDIDSGVSSFNTAERLSDTETDILQKYNEYYDDFMRNYKGREKPIEIEEFEKLSSSEIEQLLFDTKNAVEKDEYQSDVNSFEINSAEENVEVIIELLDDYGLIKQTSDGGIKISIDGSKFKPKKVDMQEYVKKLKELKALKELAKSLASKPVNIPNEGNVTAQQIEEYFNQKAKDISKGKFPTLSDVAMASRGNFSGPSGVKRVMINAWNKISFYLILDAKQKSKLYELFADRYFEGLEKAGLIKDTKEDEDDDEAFVSLEEIDIKIDNIINAVTTVKETDTPEKIKKKEEIKQKHEQYKKEYADMLASVAHVYDNVKDTLLDRKLLEAYFDGSLYEEVIETGIDYNGNARKLDDDFNVVSRYFIIEEMLFKKSAFRIFVSEILDEFFKLNYASIDIERQLGKQVKDFFTKYYPSAGIDKSGNVTGDTDVESCSQDEGRMLFNPIVRWIIGKTGYTFLKKKMKSVAAQEQSRKVFFIRNLVEIVKQYNEKYAKNKLMSIDGVEEFNEDDALFIYDDIVSNNGIIGSFVKDNLTNAADELYEKLEDYIMRFDDKTLIENVVTALAYQELHAKNKKLFTTSKEETEARNAVKDSLKDYYKTFAKDIQAIKDEY